MLHVHEARRVEPLAHCRQHLGVAVLRVLAAARDDGQNNPAFHLRDICPHDGGALVVSPNPKQLILSVCRVLQSCECHRLSRYTADACCCTEPCTALRNYLPKKLSTALHAKVVHR
eukprot:193111-Chlamydomonas_euryale.AAC.11